MSEGKKKSGFDLGRFTRQLVDNAGFIVKHTIPQFLEHELDADRVLRRTMSGLIDAAAARYPVDPGAEWKPGQPLELLLVGYSGTRNTGADVRVEEMIRQFRHLLGDDHLRLSILTLDPDKTRGYFAGVRQLSAPKLFPKFLFDVVHQHHGVVACEGSMFKSKFANALTTFMVGAIGLAGAEQKLAVGYGGEAGAMDPEVEAMVRRYCGQALVIARNTASVEVLKRLEIEASLGADTAWTFEPHAPEVGRELLVKAGWNGTSPVLVCCPINPFWWPVTADWKRGVEQALFKSHGKSHFSSVYFHADGPAVEAKQAAYIESLAKAIEHAQEKHGVFVALVGMEALDRKAAEALAKRLDKKKPADAARTPLFISDEHEHKTLVSVLRQAAVLVSSRYHAIVTSMPAGVPAVGVTMDERIRNLLGDAGLPELCIETSDAALGDKVAAGIDRVFADPASVKNALRKDVARQLRLMGTMGQTFVEAVRRRHPAFPIRPGLGKDGDPLAHLPPLSAELQALLVEFPSDTPTAAAAAPVAPAPEEAATTSNGEAA
jgi:polysaccharide pyruvyl transferase WcaK-like protein